MCYSNRAEVYNSNKEFRKVICMKFMKVIGNYDSKLYEVYESDREL